MESWAGAATAATWKASKPGDGGGKQHENLTAMLVGVVTVFIICQLPGLGIRVAYTAMEYGRASTLCCDLSNCCATYFSLLKCSLYYVGDFMSSLYLTVHTYVYACH